jgi:hypothetical protein
MRRPRRPPFGVSCAGVLGNPVQYVAKDPPDVSAVKAHACDPLDETSHIRRRPALDAESVRGCALEQGLFEENDLRSRQLSPPPRSPRAQECQRAALPPGPMPPVNADGAHGQHACDLRLLEPVRGKEARSAETTRFEPIVVTTRHRCSFGRRCGLSEPRLSRFTGRRGQRSPSPCGTPQAGEPNRRPPGGPKSGSSGGSLPDLRVLSRPKRHGRLARCRSGLIFGPA